MQPSNHLCFSFGLTGATRVLVVEDGVCEEAAGLPREDLGMGRERSYGFSRSAWWQAGCVLREAAFCVTTRPPPLGVFPTKERLPPVPEDHMQQLLCLLAGQEGSDAGLPVDARVLEWGAIAFSHIYA